MQRFFSFLGLRCGVWVLVVAGWGLTGVAWAQPPSVLRISTAAVADDWHAKMWTVLKDQLARSAPGQFDVRIHLNGVLFKQGAEPVAMARGNLEMATLSSFDLAKQVPEFSILTAGYVLRDPDHLLRVLQGPIGADLFTRASAKMDVRVLAPIYYGTRQLGLRTPRTVQTPADLRGLKLRMPSSKDWLFLGEALGAAPTPLAFGEVYLGLRTGTIDGQDNPLPTLKSAKLYEVTRQVVLTSHLVDVLFITVSNRYWNRLNATQQAALQAAAQAAAQYNNTQRLADEKQALAFLKAQGIAITTPDVAAFRTAVQARYRASPYARSWPSGWLERINATR